MIKFSKDIYINDCFRNWVEYDNIFIISDPHFNDPDMKYLRNDISADEIVDKINSVVHKRDILIVLGDIGDVSYVSKLKAGYKVLVKGNHDAGESKYRRQITSKEISAYETNSDFETVKRPREDVIASAKSYPNFVSIKECYDFVGLNCYNATYDNRLFDEIYDVLSLSDKIIMTHEPIDINPKCMLNIHGHIHSSTYVEDMYHLCVSAERIDYTPIRLKDVIESGRLSKIETLHRDTIDKATERRIKRGYRFGRKDEI